MGNTIRGCCPICQGDNSTEFVANDTVFFCHKCSSGGGIVNFVQDYEKISYVMAIDKLAEYLNIDLSNNKDYQEEKEFLKNLELGTVNAEKNISQVYPYLLNERGLAKHTIDTFRLGYANDSIIIPFRDIYNRIIGYTKRQLKQTPKYLNCKNNSLFEKNNFLFNLDRARKRIDTSIYLCEGVFDVMCGDEQGYAITGYIGSVVSKNQVKLLKSICINPYTTVVLCPDNDNAGKKSIKKTLENFRAVAPTLSVCILRLPDNCKDINDAHVLGIKLEDMQVESAELYQLKEILESCTNPTAQYMAVGEFAKSIVNPMIKADIAQYLSVIWKDKDLDDIKRWFNVVEDVSKVSVFKNLTMSLDEYVESVFKGGYSFGFPKIDASLGQIRLSDVVIIGACPGVGKTIIGGEIALYYAIKHKLNVIFFSLEMRASDLGERLIASFLGISTDELMAKVKSGELTDIYCKIKAELDKYIRIVDTSSLSIDDVKKLIAEANATQFDKPVSLIVIDYLQYMADTDTFEGISKTARKLKEIAKEFTLTVICLSQLNRSGDLGERPTMKQLKGSGDIEASGDIILLAYLKTDSKTVTMEQMKKLENVISIYIGKSRRGCTLKDVDMKFDKSKMRLREIP